MKVYAFDVDETLEPARGPVTLQSIRDLREQGHIVGICGNLAGFCRIDDWHKLVSFLLHFDTYPLFGGPMGSCLPKEAWLRVFREVTFTGAEDYVMVGNIQGVSGGSDDQGAAQRASWRFIKESDFAEGQR